MRVKRLHFQRRVDWALLAQVYPEYAGHIKRIRSSQEKLSALRIRLVKKLGYKHERMAAS